MKLLGSFAWPASAGALDRHYSVEDLPGNSQVMDVGEGEHHHSDIRMTLTIYTHATDDMRDAHPV